MSPSADRIFEPKTWAVTFGVGIVLTGGVLFGMKAIFDTGDDVVLTAAATAPAQPSAISTGRVEQLETGPRELVDGTEATLPMDLTGKAVGERRSFSLDVKPGDAPRARLTMSVFDLDGEAEARLFLNGNELEFPTGIFADERLITDWIPVNPAILIDGENTVEFELVGTGTDAPDGFRIDDVRIDMVQTEEKPLQKALDAYLDEKTAALKRDSIDMMADLKLRSLRTGERRVYELDGGRERVIISRRGEGGGHDPGASGGAMEYSRSGGAMGYSRMNGSNGSVEHKVFELPDGTQGVAVTIRTGEPRGNSPPPVKPPLF